MSGSPATPGDRLSPVAFRYNMLDITGTVGTPGSYAFLRTAGDATSAIDNFGHAARAGVQLRVHPTDANGKFRAAFYSTVQVGDTFDYRTEGLRCVFRFRVTSIGTTRSPRTFGIEVAAKQFATSCGSVDDPEAPKNVEFFWRVQPGLPGPGGVRVMLHDEPTGEGTYRLEADVPWIIDVPAGMRVINNGRVLAGGSWGVSLVDEATNSVLFIYLQTGTEWERRTRGSGVDVLFDQIIASIRRP